MAAETKDDCDLPPEVVRKVHEMHARLDSLDHYALLGVARDAPRSRIRSSLLSAASPFHPDRYFGKRLGACGPMMQLIFARMSIAHETLLDAEARAAYDEALPPPEPVAAPDPPPAPIVTTPPAVKVT